MIQVFLNKDRIVFSQACENASFNVKANVLRNNFEKNVASNVELSLQLEIGVSTMIELQRTAIRYTYNIQHLSNTNTMMKKIQSVLFP